MKKIFSLVFILAAIAGYSQAPDNGPKTVTASGTDTYTIVGTSPAQYTLGEKWAVKFTNANTGAATLNRSTKGAKAIKKNGTTALSSGDIPAGSIQLIIYDGTNFQCTTCGGSGGGSGTVATLAEALAGANDTHFMSPLKNNYVSERVFNVQGYGGIGDGQRIYANVTATSSTITSGTSVFVAGDVGKIITISEAGTAGVPIHTTIATYISPTQVTISTPIVTSVTGAMINWGTDNTTALLAAGHAVVLAGGGVITAPIGVYYYRSPLVTVDAQGNNPNSQIYIETAATLAGKVKITIRGMAAMTYPLSTDGSLSLNGTVFYSLLTTTSGTNPSFFGTYGSDPDTFNKTDISIENINLLVYTNNGTHAPYLSGWNLLNFGVAGIHYSGAYRDSSPFTSVTPAGSGTVGIAVGRIYDDGNNIVRNCASVGFENGYVLGDHTQIINSGAFYNTYGLTPINQTHAVTGMITLEANDRAIRFPAGSTFMGYTIGNYSPIDLFVSYEYNNSGSHWYDSQYFIEDLASPSRGRGQVKFTNFGINDGDLINLNHFTTGTLGISLIPFGNFAPRQFTTAVGGLVTHAGDWTKDNAIIAVGTGASAATQYGDFPSFQTEAQQANLSSSLIGSMRMLNNGKRSFTINALTNGVIDTDQIRAYVQVGGNADVEIFRSDGLSLGVSKPLYLPLYANDAAADTACGGSCGDGAEYYNTTTHKKKVKENGTWKTVTTS